MNKITYAEALAQTVEYIVKARVSAEDAGSTPVPLVNVNSVFLKELMDIINNFHEYLDSTGQDPNYRAHNLEDLYEELKDNYKYIKGGEDINHKVVFSMMEHIIKLQKGVDGDA